MSLPIELLEVLQYKTGCMYLSDLHIPENTHLVLHAIKKINPEFFSLQEWTDAICYITEQEVQFNKISDAVRYLEGYSHERK